MKLKKLKSDGEDVIPQAEIIEADQYKRSYFGPDVPTLELECWEEELSEAQLKAFKHADEEYKSIQNKLDDIVKETGGEIVYNGDQFTAYQLLGKQPVLKDLESKSAEIIRSRSRSLSVTKEPPKGKRGRPRKKVEEEDRDYSPSPPPSPEHKSKKKHKKDKEKHREKDSKTKDKTLAPSNVHSVVTNVRPSEATAVGGLSTGSATKATAIVDLTKEEGNKHVADSREVAFNKLQGKTFPSLVVVARPYLRTKDSTVPSDRSTLDSKVKSVLMHTPTKFTEWLIHQGLVRSEQWCVIHPGNKLKLGMYSDILKFPYSGGYVWISECCPTRFVSVFCSSIFEGATHPPSVILKLVYHWACQTNVQNVVQWVKVDNLYVKSLFTWLRAVCTAATAQHMPLLGGAGRRVEVGVISLGTTSHDGTQRQVKVEVLGVLDVQDKLIRLRAVEPLSENEKNYRKRFQKILEPLSGWVHPASTVLTDLTVDKSTLVSMGFKTVHQSSSQSAHSNANIMEYLRRIVPRMFQNTLSLLSRQIIQQFLDELVWREKFGVTPGQAFDNVVEHIAEQTKVESRDAVTVRLNKIAANPFKNWKYGGKASKGQEAEPEVVPKKRGRKRKEPSPPPFAKKERKSKKTPVVDIDDIDEEMPLALRKKIKKESADKAKDPDKPSRGRRRRERSAVTVDDDDDELDVPLKNIKKELKPEETLSMEKYYFGQSGGAGPHARVAINVECPLCQSSFTSSGELQSHLLQHAAPPGALCRYCVAAFDSEDALSAHAAQAHPRDTKTENVFTYACLICEVRFAAVLTLASHMQKSHAPLELPYRCGACDYRASARRVLLDHFHAAHGRADCVQCPSCLMTVTVYADGQDMRSNVLLFLDHLRAHREPALPVKCSRCVLQFVHLGQLKEHQIRDHGTVPGAVTLCSEDHLITKPKNKPRPPIKDARSHTMSASYAELTLSLPPGAACRECGVALDAEDHFLGVTSCTNCPFTTSCYREMLRHSGYCAGPHSLEDAPRAAPLSHCVCGYSNAVGTDMLTHLLSCERRSAYAAPEDARANIRALDDAPVADAPAADAPATAAPPGDAPAVDAPPAQTSPEPEAPPEYAPPSVLNTQLTLDDLAPPSVLQPDQNDELLKDAYDRPLATPRHEDPAYTLGDFEPLPQEPTPQPDFEQL